MDRRLHLYRKQTIDGDTAQVRPGIAKPIVKWNAQDAGLEDLSKCGLADRDHVSLRSLGAR